MKKIWKKYKKVLLTYLVSTTIGVSYGLLVASNIDEPSFMAFLLRFLEGMLFFVLSMLLQIILHEVGHLIAGLIRKWTFLSFMIFGFVISRKEGRLHFSRLNIAGAGGQCLMMPPSGGDTDNGLTFYNAGGILMNTLVSFLAILALTLGCTMLSFESASLLYGLAMTGIIFALINGIPKATGDIPNDGENIASLKKDGFSSYVFQQSLRVIGLMHRGKTLTRINPGYFCEGRDIDYSNPIHAMALSFDISLAIGRHDFERAHRMVQHIYPHEAEISRFYMNEIRMETLYLFLVDAEHVEKPLKLLDKELRLHVDSQLCFRPAALRVKYTWTRLLERNDAEAAKLYERFTKVCKGYHISGEIPTEQELIDYARSLTPPDRQVCLTD